MDLKVSYIIIISLLLVFSGCHPKGNNPGEDQKIKEQEIELLRIEPLISHYYATNLDSAEYYCYRKIELLKSIDRFEPVVETNQFLTGLYRYHQSDPLKPQVLNDKLIIADTNTKLAIKYLKYRQSMASKIVILQRITNLLILVIGLIAALAALLIVRHWKRMNVANMKLARLTMEIIVNEAIIHDTHPASSQKDGSGDLV